MNAPRSGMMNLAVRFNARKNDRNNSGVASATVELQPYGDSIVADATRDDVRR